MNKIITALFAIMSIPSYANVVITEYIEGGSNNKALEISNLGSENVDLAVEGYKLTLYANGSSTGKNELLLQGLLVPNSSLVVYNASATDAFKKTAPQGYLDSTSVTFFNGDDAIVLSNNSGIVDAFGQVGTDPGSYWGEGDFTSKDHTLRRLASVTQGDIVSDDAFTLTTEWVAFAKDTADGLGCVGEATCTGTEPLPEAGTSIGGSAPGDTTPTDEICTNCPTIEKIADRNTYDDALYYANANAANGDNFRSALITDISKNQKQFTYSEVWTALTYTDEDPNNSSNIILLYSGRSIAKKDNGSGAASSNPDFWNREHVWPKSHGFPEQSQRGYTDIHHLRPADISINSSRGNKDFEIGGDPLTESPENSTTESTWEPRNEVKGDIARMTFYMDVRYDTGTDATMPDLILVDEVGTQTSTLSDGVGKLAKLCTLLEWNAVDPVSTFEIERNNTIYEYQGNRNPFIDHPEWVERIYSNVCAVNEIPSVDAGTDQTLNSGDTVTLSATASDSDGSIETYQWVQTSGTTVELTNADSATATFISPTVTSNSALVFTVTVTDNQGEIATDTVTINVTPVAATTEPPVEKSSGGGSFYWLIAMLTFVLSTRKIRLARKF